MAAPGRTQVTRLVNGFTNVADNNILADYGLPDPTKWITQFDDFVNYNTGNWTLANTGTGTAFAVVNSIAGGAIAAVTGAVANNNYTILSNSLPFLLDATKRAFFKCRFKVDNVATSYIFAGIMATAARTTNDGIYFLKNSTSGVDIVCRKDSSTGSTSATAIATMANDTFVDLAWFYDGAGTLYYAVNGVVTGSLSVASYFPDANVGLCFGVETNTTAARTGTVDYLFASVER